MHAPALLFIVLQIAKANMKEIMTKVQSSSAWGAVSSWTEDKFKTADALLDGFDAAELVEVGTQAFKGAMDSFGKISTWTEEQSKVLANKAKAAWGSVKKASATEIRKARGFLNGFSTQDLADVATDVFEDAVDAFETAGNKIGAWTTEQAATLGSQVKKTFGAARTFTRKTIEKVGSLIGTLDVSDLKELTDEALKSVKGGAVKIMGATTAASAWTAHKFNQLAKETKDQFNGNALKILAKDSLDKLKAVLSCGGAGERKCPAVVIDITIDHDLTTSAADLMSQVSDLLTSTAGIAVRVVQDSTSLLDSPSRRRRRLEEKGRGGDADVQSVVRMELPATANAQLVASEVASIGQTDSVNIDANLASMLGDTSVNGGSGEDGGNGDDGGNGGVIAVAVLLPMLAIAAALIGVGVYKKKMKARNVSNGSSTRTVIRTMPTSTAKVQSAETKVAEDFTDVVNPLSKEGTFYRNRCRLVISERPDFVGVYE